MNPFKQKSFDSLIGVGLMLRDMKADVTIDEGHTLIVDGGCTPGNLTVVYGRHSS
jgi:hypothetical protein